MTIQLFMVTTDKPCKEIGLDIRTFYSELIKQYFENYGYLSVDIDHSCATVEEIDSDAFEQDNSQLDLVIFIPDKQESEKYREIVLEDGKRRLGHFWSATDPPEIWSTTSSLGADARQEIWTLSHELSHFILFNLGYPQNVWGGDDEVWNGAQKSYVHQIHDGFYECARETIPYSCSNHKIKSSSGRTLEVMPIYDKPIPIQEPERETMVTEMQEKSEQSRPSSWQEENEWGGIFMGVFFPVGIPVIIIGLIIWKIKQRRGRTQVHQES